MRRSIEPAAGSRRADDRAGRLARSLALAFALLAAGSAAATGTTDRAPRGATADQADDIGAGGVPITGGIGSSGLCGALPRPRVPSTCAGI